MEDDDDSDPHPNANSMHAQGSRRQKRQGKVVSGRCVPPGPCCEVQHRLSARWDAEATWPQPKPDDVLAAGLDPRPPTQRANEPRARDVDPQGAAPRVSHGDDGGGRTPEGHAKRAGAEPDAAAGRGTREGCRGRNDDDRREEASHRPIAVKVSVAV
jgi:hypothetical protein